MAEEGDSKIKTFHPSRTTTKIKTLLSFAIDQLLLLLLRVASSPLAATAPPEPTPAAVPARVEARAPARSSSARRHPAAAPPRQRPSRIGTARACGEASVGSFFSPVSPASSETPANGRAGARFQLARRLLPARQLTVGYTSRRGPRVSWIGTVAWGGRGWAQEVGN